jgi:hypothetical protein
MGFFKTLKGKLVTLGAVIALIAAVVDPIVAWVRGTAPLACMAVDSFPWCPAPSQVWSKEVGGPGGTDFGPLACTDSELLVGLFGKTDQGPVIFSMGPICAKAQFNWRHQPVSISQISRKGDDTGSNQGTPFELSCSANMFIVGYDLDSAEMGTNAGVHEYLVKPLKLRCLSVPVAENSPPNSVAQSDAPQGNASHKPFQCPAGSAAYAIKGKSGQFIDAVSLGCQSF